MRGIVTREMLDDIPEIDYNYGCRFFLDNMDNYTKALMSILKSIKSKLPILHLMSTSNEYEGLRTITQILRKMLANVGATGMAEKTYQLEIALLNEDTTNIQYELNEYILSLYEFSDQLEALLKKIDINQEAKNEEEPSSFLNYDFTKTKESIKLSANLLERKII